MLVWLSKLPQGQKIEGGYTTILHFQSASSKNLAKTKSFTKNVVLLA
jgi:hypothetical protein